MNEPIENPVAGGCCPPATGSAIPATELNELAATWKRMASVCDAGTCKLVLESCALDLERLADSWSSPNAEVSRSHDR